MARNTSRASTCHGVARGLRQQYGCAAKRVLGVWLSGWRTSAKPSAARDRARLTVSTYCGHSRANSPSAASEASSCGSARATDTAGAGETPDMGRSEM